MLPICRRDAMEAGEYDGHLLVCEHRPPAPPVEPETEPLFGLTPLTTEERAMPDYPVIDVWAVLRDPDIPAEVGQRLLDRQRAIRAGETPELCPEEDKPFLARHIVSAASGPIRNSSERSGTETPDA